MKIPKILMVDYSSFILKSSQAFMDEKHFQLLVATDRQQAFQIIKTELPDLIIMDIVVPRLDDGRFCAELNADPAASSIPVIVVIDADQHDDINDALTFGYSEYITKPLNKNSIVETIRKKFPIVDRRDPRISCNIPVEIQVDDDLIMVPCDNISVSGIFVKGNLAMTEGREVTITFRLPGLTGKVAKITAKGHVVWVNNKRRFRPEDPMGFGIKLDEIIGERLNRQQSTELMAFIESRKE